MVATRMDQMHEGIVETIRDPLLMLDEEHRVITVSRSFYEFFKVTPEETVGQLIYDLGNKQWDIPRLRELLENILPQKTSFDNYEIKHDFATIGKRTMLLNARQIEKVMGKERTILLAIEDVTDRRRLEYLVADSEERYRRLFETADDGILLLEKSDLKIRFANPAITEMLGYSKEELVGKGFKNIGFADNIGNFQEVMQALNRDGIIHYKDASIRKKTGQVVETDVYMVNKARLVQCNIRNIAERKRTEEALRKSESFLRSTLDGLSAHITVLDERGEIILTNKAYRDFVECNGVDPGAVFEGTNYLAVCDTASGENSQEAAPFAEGIRDVLSGKLSSFELEYPCHSPDEKRWFIGRVTPIQGEGPRRVVIAHENVTGRKQATDAQQHSNELMQYIIEHTNSAVAVHDRDLRYMYVSERYLKDYRVQEQDIIGKHHYDVFPDLPEKWREVHRKALAGQVSSSERDPYERADGTVEWTRWECRPWYEANGSIGGIIVYTEVITERVQAEEALRESEQRHRILFEDALNPILLVDENGHYVDANEAALQFMECDREKLMGRSVWDFAPPGILERQKQEHSPFVERRTLETDYLIHGQFKTLLLNIVPLEAGGRTILCGIGLDITERKQTEKALIRQQRSITLSNRIANVFLTSSRNEVFTDVLDILLKALDSRFGYFGYIDEAGDLVCPSMTRDVWNQCQVAEKTVVFPRSAWGGLWGRALMEKQTLVSNENLRIPEGHVPLESALATPIVHHDNLIGQFVVANKVGGYGKDERDLLESVAVQTAPILFAIQEEARQKAAHEKLEEQMRQAQKMESVGRLAGGVAHDFNNMLSVILGNAELSMENMAPDDPLYNNLREIFSAARRSADITRQLLAFARKQTIAPKVLDLNRTIKSMLKMLQRLIGEDIDLVWLPDTTIWPVRMDPSQIDQILANLCVNARDAIADVGKITIETGTVTFDSAYCAEHLGFVAGDFVLMAVSDDGCGMDSETMSHLFEPFFTTKDVEKGTGLGLATVYGIIKQNDGFINVYSEPGHGTTFRIYLPRYLTKTESLEYKTSDKIHMDGTETILLVEDEPSILRMTQIMLERMGYKILAAGTPGEAIAHAREHAGEIHLLMTDVVMPEMNGRDLARNLLSLYPNIKRLFMSGYTANVIAHHGVLDEGVQFIQKPFSREQLGTKVREVLGEDTP